MKKFKIILLGMIQNWFKKLFKMTSINVLSTSDNKKRSKYVIYKDLTQQEKDDLIVFFTTDAKGINFLFTKLENIKDSPEVVIEVDAKEVHIDLYQIQTLLLKELIYNSVPKKLANKIKTERDNLKKELSTKVTSKKA